MAARVGVGLVGRFLGNAVSEAAAFAAGVAIGPVLGPPLQAVRNEVNSQYPLVPPGAGVLAEGVAQGQVPEKQARTWASYQGIGDAAFTALVNIANVGPGVAPAFDLWRRNLITDGQFKTALKRAAIEDEWVTPLMGLREHLLTPSELANAVVQGHRDFDLAAAQAELQGISQANFQTLVDNTGLPPGPETLLAWQRRGILTPDEVAQGIREGHTKVKYIDKYAAALHPVLSHTTYAGLRLRGWITPQESYAGGALTGYTQEQMDQEFLNRGRPATAHQIHIGYARGAKLAGAANEEAAIRKAIQQSDIRPEYADLIVAGRYTLPSVFALRTLVSSGALTQRQGEDILVQSGWVPDYAATVAAFWAHPSNATATLNPRVKRAQDQVYNAAHKSYLDNEIDRTRALAAMEHLGLTTALAVQVVDLWEYENEITVKPLTAAQIKKAYSANDLTVDEATARLVDQQWSAADAAIYLKS